MTKQQVTLVATALVAYGGRSYGHNMQFNADAEDVADLIKSGQAVEAKPLDKTPRRVVSSVEYSVPANAAVAAKAPVTDK